MKQRERKPADPYAARKGNSLIQCDHRTYRPPGEVRPARRSQAGGDGASGQAEGRPGKQGS